MVKFVGFEWARHNYGSCGVSQRRNNEDRVPSPRRLDPHPAALRAHVDDTRNVQSALVDHRRREYRLVGAALDGELCAVLSAVRICLAPCPSVANRGRDREFAPCNQRHTDYNIPVTVKPVLYWNVLKLVTLLSTLKLISCSTSE